MNAQQEFIQQLIQQETKLSLEEFFNGIHERFYPAQDISFMNYFLELTKHEGEIIVHHEKLVEYGVMSSKRSSDVKDRLDALGLIEDEEYREVLRDIPQNLPVGGRPKKVYMLTPEAFKTCLMRARKYPNQTVDPAVYSKYYLLLEKTYKLYTDYQLKQKDKQLEQNQQELQRKTLDLEEERQYRIGLEEGLMGNATPLEPVQIIYIATSQNYANQNRFKIGGVLTLGHLEGRLATYNTGRANGDEFFYVEWFQVVCYKDMEKRLETLIGRFKDSRRKEMYILPSSALRSMAPTGAKPPLVHLTNLKYIVEYIVTHYNEETDMINERLGEFIKNLNRRELRPSIVQPKPLNRVQIQRVGQPDVVITTNTTESLITRIETYINNLNRDIQVVNAKQVFDNLEIKTGRRPLYTVLKETMERLLPNAKMVKF
jgi:hypothetical protein